VVAVDDRHRVERPSVRAETVSVRDAERSTIHTDLPPDLEADAAYRLRVVVLLYAFVFFVVSPVSAFLSPAEREAYFSSALRWAPPVASIGLALIVAALTRISRIPVRTILGVGLVFEVIASYGVAAAEYGDIDQFTATPPWVGLSWVAVWVLSYTIMIPSTPRRALLAAVGSAAAVPFVTGAVLVFNPGIASPTPVILILRVLVPYGLIVVLGYTGSRIVYRLGTELKHARELGSYRLTERLGQGGMGEVWRAEHRFLARPAAIKLIRADFGAMAADREMELRARFEREAQATASLRSPHTIELYDFGIADDGTFYYVMELLEGVDLQVFVERFGPVPVARTVHLLKQLCESLAEAHDRGLIHRDIKPANVFVCRYGREVDFVKVLDFGLVKSIERDLAATHLNVTVAPAAQGTPAFMAPEQALGDRSVDGRSDIYAVGCLGYWLVTGRRGASGSNRLDGALVAGRGAPMVGCAFSRRRTPDEVLDLVWFPVSDGLTRSFLQMEIAGG
jgi:tRNA A-37 threonylcarbamoyl transferase component Bud32